METVMIPGALPTKGHYVPAVKDGSVLYISGQLPFDPSTGEPCRGDIREQTRRALSNFGNVIAAAGAAKEDVVKVVVYISDINLWEEVNQLYGEFFGNHFPARSIVPTRSLHYDFLIEIEGIAHLH